MNVSLIFPRGEKRHPTPQNLIVVSKDHAAFQGKRDGHKHCDFAYLMGIAAPFITMTPLFKCGLAVLQGIRS
jgi:hypothetical protein